MNKIPIKSVMRFGEDKGIVMFINSDKGIVYKVNGEERTVMRLQFDSGEIIEEPYAQEAIDYVNSLVYKRHYENKDNPLMFRIPRIVEVNYLI